MNRHISAGLVLLLAAITLSPGPAGAQLAGSSWPMFHQGINHAGLSSIGSVPAPHLYWTFATTDSIFDTSPAIDADGNIYVGSLDGGLYSVHPWGALRWKFQAGGALRYSSPAVAADGTVYIGGMDSTFYAVNPTGTLKWKFRGGSTFRSSPVIAADGTIYVGNGDNNLYAFNPNGTVRWTHAAGNNVRSSPAIGPTGAIYVGSDDSKLYSLNAATGAVNWTFLLGSAADLATPTVAADGTIYMGSTRGPLYAINPNGTLKWFFDTKHVVYTAPAILPNGNVIVATGSDVTALNPATGAKIWQYVDTNLTRTSPAIASDGTIYVGVLNDSLVALTSAGAVRWVYRAALGIESSPIIAPDGTVYFGSFDGRLYAIGARTSGVPEGPPPAVEVTLSPPFPNPSRGAVRFTFSAMAAASGTLNLYALDGRLVRRLYAGAVTSTPLSAAWDGLDDAGKPAASGIYWAVLNTPAGRITRRAVVIR